MNDKLKAWPARRRLLAAAASLLAGNQVARASGPPDAQKILAASDAVRNPRQPFKVTVTLTEFEGGKQVDTNTLVTYSRLVDSTDQFASLTRFVLPARDTGKLMLRNGDDLWFFDPGTKASIRLSPQQRLLGQAANGDVVTVNFARDYEARLAAQETITDGERLPRATYKLALTATAPSATYSVIELWVDAENNSPIKALFYAESGRLLKTAFYRKFQRQLCASRPTETVIIDGLNTRSVTLIRFSEFAFQNVPASWFQREFLPRFQPE